MLSSASTSKVFVRTEYSMPMTVLGLPPGTCRRFVGLRCLYIWVHFPNRHVQFLPNAYAIQSISQFTPRHAYISSSNQYERCCNKYQNKLANLLLICIHFFCFQETHSAVVYHMYSFPWHFSGTAHTEHDRADYSGTGTEHTENSVVHLQFEQIWPSEWWMGNVTCCTVLLQKVPAVPNVWLNAA